MGFDVAAIARLYVIARREHCEQKHRRAARDATPPGRFDNFRLSFFSAAA
jgi:hypothetical protein